MDLMYTTDCLNIYESECYPKGSEYYPLVKEGFDFAFYISLKILIFIINVILCI